MCYGEIEDAKKYVREKVLPLDATLKSLDFEYIEQENKSAYLIGGSQYAAKAICTLVGSVLFYQDRLASIGICMSCRTEEGCIYGFSAGHTFESWENELKQLKHIYHPLYSQQKVNDSPTPVHKKPLHLAGDCYAALTEMEIDGSLQTIDVAIFKLCNRLHNNKTYDLNLPRSKNVPLVIFQGQDETLMGREVCKQGLYRICLKLMLLLQSYISSVIIIHLTKEISTIFKLAFDTKFLS